MEERNTFQLVQESIDHIREIFRKEILLAKAETREEAAMAAKAAGMGAGAILFLVFTIQFLLWTVLWALAPRMQFWTASLIVAVGTLLFAAILGGLAYSRFKQLSPKPERATRQLKETVSWAKRQHV